MRSFYFLVDLLGLLKWNSMVGKLKHVLVDVVRVSGEEIVKVPYGCNGYIYVTCQKEVVICANCRY